MSDRFTTVAANVRVKIPVGSCRFIASVARVETEEQAKGFIVQVCSEFQNATHNAYAYRIGLGDMVIERCSDAGEPAGTAGPPILQAIIHAGLTQVVVVGTRYFGGVKLGIGGLVRAYRLCAEAGLAEAGKIVEIFKDTVVIETPYELLGSVMRELSACQGEVIDVTYNERGAVVSGRLPRLQIKTAHELILEATKGKAVVVLGNTRG